jgi:UDP-N-acetyl-D-glucosamine dehydrogenase
LEAAQECRFEVGKDIFLVFSPERVDPGRTDWTTSNTPKVVGGVTTHCSDMGVALYKSVVEEVVLVSSPKTAEMVKLLENTFRATNIGLVNEMSVMCDRLGIDVWEVIDAAKTKPFGFMPFYPGPGLGGHCLPIDPHYLAWKLKNLDYTARFIQLADEINLGMPLYWVTKAQDELNNRGKPLRNSKVLVLGVAYKPDIDDARESPAIDVIDHLIEKGADVTYHDSNVPYLDVESGRLSSISDADFWAALADADCVLIVTDHTNYDWVEIQNNASLIVDTRNAMRKGAVSRGTKATG